MQARIVDDEITLVPYYPNPDVALAWYQDPTLCKQVDNSDTVYTPQRLEAMYTFLSTHGRCYYIQYRGMLVGDIALRDNAEVCLAVCRRYQNRHIGRRCVRNILALAAELGLKEVKANIYAFNTQSRRMFAAVGFVPAAEAEWYVYHIV